MNERRQITWHPCDSPMCPTFLSEFSKLHQFIEIPDITIVYKFTNVHEIDWDLQAMPKSDKQWQKLYKVRKSDERATNEKKV